MTGIQTASVDLSLLSDQVYELLRSEILTGHLRPKERVTVSGLAARFGLSPTPVRDALRRLNADGLVEVRPRRGTSVAAFDGRSVREIFQVRRIVECAAADELPRASGVSLSRLQDLVDAMERLRTGDTFADYAAFISLDAEFHRGIVALLENRRLGQFYEALRWPILVVRGLSQSPFQRAGATVSEHRRIAAALQHRDVERAKQAVLDHLRNAETDLLGRIESDASGGEP